MAERVKIASISGLYANTTDGRKLRIIGNVNPQGYAYTDGVVVYGYANNYAAKPYIPTKARRPGLPFYPFNITQYEIDGRPSWRYADVAISWFDSGQKFVEHLGQPVNFSYDFRGPWFVNTRNSVLIRKFDFTNHTISYLNEKGHEIIPPYKNAALLAYRDGKAYMQTGDFRKTQRITSFQYGTYTYNIDDKDWIGHGYKALEGNETDLQFDGTPLASYIEQILNIIRSKGVGIYDFALYPDNSFYYQESATSIPNTDPYEYGGGLRFQYAGDSGIIFWLTVAAIKQITNTAEIYRYNVGYQLTNNSLTEVYWNVDKATYAGETRLVDCTFTQTEHRDNGYTISYEGHSWTKGVLDGQYPIPKEPRGICDYKHKTYVLTDGVMYVIDHGALSSMSFTGPDPYYTDVRANNAGLCPVDDLQRFYDSVNTNFQ